LAASHLLGSREQEGYQREPSERVLAVTLKTAWFMGHRIRLAMIENPSGLMGSGGGIV
jgi:hypothetical protein